MKPLGYVTTGGDQPTLARAEWRATGEAGGESVNIRSLLYSVAKLMGDVNAVKKGKVGKRIGPQSCRKAHRANPREVVQVTHAPA